MATRGKYGPARRRSGCAGVQPGSAGTGSRGQQGHAPRDTRTTSSQSPPVTSSCSTAVTSRRTGRRPAHRRRDGVVARRRSRSGGCRCRPPAARRRRQRPSARTARDGQRPLLVHLDQRPAAGHGRASCASSRVGHVRFAQADLGQHAEQVGQQRPGVAGPARSRWPCPAQVRDGGPAGDMAPLFTSSADGRPGARGRRLRGNWWSATRTQVERPLVQAGWQVEPPGGVQDLRLDPGQDPQPGASRGTGPRRRRTPAPRRCPAARGRRGTASRRPRSRGGGRRSRPGCWRRRRTSSGRGSPRRA